MSLCTLFICYTTLTVVCSVEIVNAVENLRIMGGKTIDISESPYLVSLRHKKNKTTPFEHRCAGTIYSDDIVLTTGTCVIGTQAQYLHILAGSSYGSQNDGYLFLVQQYVVHPDFQILLKDHDLALVKLAFSFSFNSRSIRPIPVATQLPSIGKEATISGWGASSNNFAYTEHLRSAELEILSIETCKEEYGDHRITDTMICAGSPTADACLGDVGGPLVINNTAVGLVSWGSFCRFRDFPGVFTNLVYLRDWIEEQALNL